MIARGDRQKSVHGEKGDRLRERRGQDDRGNRASETTPAKPREAEKPAASQGSIPKTPATPPPLTVISRYGSSPKFVEAVTQKLGTGILRVHLVGACDRGTPGEPGPKTPRSWTRSRRSWNALQNPKLYAEVPGEAWDLVKAGNAADINDALLTMARKSDLPVSTIKRVKRPDKFFK